MHPILFKLGPLTIHTFGPLVALASFIAILIIRREGKRRGFDPELLTSLAVETLLVGVAGSRLLFVLITPESFPIRPEQPWYENYFIQYIALWRGGLVWYGGFLPATFYVMWRARNMGLPVRTTCDIFAPAIIGGLAVGRIGCLMAGDDHGKLVASGAHWWTITFSATPEQLEKGEGPLLSDMSLLGKPLYPTQPLMSIGDFLIFLIMMASRKRLKDRPLGVFLVLMTLYPILRFGIEMIRGDTIRKFLIEPKDLPSLGGISTSQAISIPVCLIAGTLLIVKVLRPPTGEEKPSPEVAVGRDEKNDKKDEQAAKPA